MFRLKGSEVGVDSDRGNGVGEIEWRKSLNSGKRYFGGGSPYNTRKEGSEGGRKGKKEESKGAGKGRKGAGIGREQGKQGTKEAWKGKME